MSTMPQWFHVLSVVVGYVGVGVICFGFGVAYGQKVLVEVQRKAKDARSVESELDRDMNNYSTKGEKHVDQ